MNIAKIQDVFKEAQRNGLINLRLVIGSYKIKKAAENGKNKGWLYITCGADYKGKVSPENVFCASPNCEPGEIADIAKLIDSPMSEAILHGQRTGQCSICGRGLLNEDSIALGIGPICAEKVGAFLPQEILDRIKATELPAKKSMPFIDIPEDF